MNLKFFTVAIALFATAIASQANAETPAKHSDMCDASAAVPISSSLFVVANDEDNILRVYKRDESGESVYSKDISTDLKIKPKKKHSEADILNYPEADIEGATLIGNRIYWITSHGTNSGGEQKPNRHRIFATDIEHNGDKVNLKPVGTPFVDLVQALENADNLKPFNLGKAAEKAPESEGGLNIEGLASTPEGHLLIGFRNPIPDKKALLVTLENPQAVIEDKKQPKLGKPISLDLGGLGIRSIEYSQAKSVYFIIAGSYNDDGNFQLYSWSGKTDDAATLVKGVDFQGLNPEALIIYPEEKTRIQILSDDGSKDVEGVACKDLKNAEDKSFRSIWLNIN